jgi:hypothetical protein
MRDDVQRAALRRSLDVVERQRNVLVCRLFERPGLPCRRHAAAGAQIEDPDIVTPVPEVTGHVRPDGVVREGGAAGAVAVNHHDGRGASLLARIAREPHSHRGSIRQPVDFELGDLRCRQPRHLGRQSLRFTQGLRIVAAQIPEVDREQGARQIEKE